MILTSELAQQIVDKIIPVVHQNINIMNEAGIIIGSGQNHRLNTFHKGAKDVIDTGRVVEIYPEDSDRYPGSLAGLNWPIILGNQVVGAVGISGHPDAVRNTAELVKMVTELILERETLLEQIHTQSQLHEQFVLLLLSEQAAANYSQLTARASLLHFDMLKPRLAAVANVLPVLENAQQQYGTYDLVTSRARESLLQAMETADLIGENDLAAFVENKLVILKYFPAPTSSAQMEAWGASVALLISRDSSERFPLDLSLGSLVDSPLELRISYQEALYILSRRPNIPGTSMYNLDALASYLVHNPNAAHSCTAFTALKDKLTNQLDVKYDMRNTIQSLLQNNLTISATAKSLFIHRNTLIFRLTKLKQYTGLRPTHSINHALLCKFIYNEG